MKIYNALKLAGSPRALVNEWLYNKDNLPHGATEHLEEAPEEARSALKLLLEKYKNVFPPKLKKEIPPDCGLNDDHHILLVPDAIPPVKKMYHYSPAELL